MTGWLISSALAICAVLIFWYLSNLDKRVILQLLENDVWWTGRELIKASGGKLKPGTIYSSLYELESDGLIESVDEPTTDPRIGISRRLYKRVLK